MLKICKFDVLKSYPIHFIKGFGELAYSAHLATRAQMRKNGYLAHIASLEAEVAELKGQILAQKGEESQAGKHALQLFWENSTLQSYKDHAEGILRDWVPRSDYAKLNARFDKLKTNYATLESSSKAMERDWAEFINKYDVRSAQK